MEKKTRFAYCYNGQILAFVSCTRIASCAEFQNVRKVVYHAYYSVRFPVVFIYPELSQMFAVGRITQDNKPEI